MKIDKEQVLYVADLARLNLTDEEIEEMTRDMGSIIDFVDQMEGLELEDIVATAQILPIKNVFRKDLVVNSMDKELLLSNAPKQKDGCFSVPKVLES